MKALKRVRDLRPGDTVLSDDGSERKVIGYPQGCRAAGYVYVNTDNVELPINMRGDWWVRVKQPLPLIGDRPQRKNIDAYAIKNQLRGWKPTKYRYLVWNMDTDRMVTAHRSLRAAIRSRSKASRRYLQPLVKIFQYNAFTELYVLARV